MSEQKGFIIIDDHPSMRVGIRTVLEKSGEFVSVGEGGTVKEMYQLVRKKRPDIALVDINLASGSGFDIFSGALMNSAQPKVLFISVYLKPTYVVKAITLGAAGYITKNSSTETILRAARTVAEGHHYFDPYASDALAKWIRSIPNAGELVENDRYNALSEREKEIFLLLAQGKRSGEVASLLNISCKTASNYRNSIMRTLELDSDFELQAFAEEMGLLY